MGTLVRLPRPLSLIVPYSRRLMIVLRLALHRVVSDGLDFGLFIEFPQQVCDVSQRPLCGTLVRLP